MGLAMMPISTPGMEALPPLLSGRASSFINLVRQVSASFGIAFLTYVMSRRQAYHFSCLRDGFAWSSPLAPSALQQIKQTLALPGDGALAAINMAAQRQAMAGAIAETFIVSAVMVAAAIPLALFLGRKEKVAREG